MTHESWARQIGWLGWLSNLFVLTGWLVTIIEVRAGVRQDTWWIICLGTATALTAYCNWRDWRTVRRNRAKIDRLTNPNRYV